MSDSANDALVHFWAIIAGVNAGAWEYSGHPLGAAATVVACLLCIWRIAKGEGGSDV
jgi:hypothetical protein